MAFSTAFFTLRLGPCDEDFVFGLRQTHTKDLHPHVCGRCQKRFKSKEELSEHMETHVQEKPYR